MWAEPVSPTLDFSPVCGAGACVHSRRGFLKAFGALGLAGAVASTPGFAQSAIPTLAATRRIDVHHHVYPPEWFAAKRDFILNSSDNPPAIMTQWTPARAIEQMDKNGIATGIASVGNPGVWFGDVAEARRLSRLANEGMAKIASDHPGRFGVFAALALPDVEGSLKEIEYAFDTLNVDGVHLLTSYGDKWPGDAAFDPVFAELNRRKAIVFIHPTGPDCCSVLNTGAPPSIMELPFDEARAIGSLVFNGTIAKYREIRFIFTHAGGPMPVLSARMEQLMRRPTIAERNPDGILATLRTLYFDVANSTVSPPAMAALLAFAKPDHIFFGTDYPYVDMEKTVGGLDHLGLSAETLIAVNRGNAVKLFPKFG